MINDPRNEQYVDPGPQEQLVSGTRCPSCGGVGAIWDGEFLRCLFCPYHLRPPNKARKAQEELPKKYAREPGPPQISRFRWLAKMRNKKRR